MDSAALTAILFLPVNEVDETLCEKCNAGAMLLSLEKYGKQRRACSVIAFAATASADGL